MLRKIATLALAAGLVAAASPAQATSVLYAGNDSNSSYGANLEFMTVDIPDANPMTVISSGNTYGIDALAWNPTTQIMYGGNENNRFFTINPVSGAQTLINGATTYQINDLAFGPGGVLYGGASGGRLFTVDTTTGAMTSIGVGARGIAALAYDPVSGIMYGSNGGDTGVSDTYFFSINLSTGAQTQIGGAISSNNIYGMSIDPATGVLYGIGWFNSLLFDYGTYVSINKTTGAVTQLNGSTPQPGNALAFIPEPGTMLLLGMGLVGLGVSGRKKA